MTKRVLPWKTDGMTGFLADGKAQKKIDSKRL